MAAHGITIITGLVSVPLTVGYLGQERYGVWLTLSSLLTWLAVADLGFGGNALINAISEARGLDDRSRVRELTATAFWALAGMAATLGIILAFVLRFTSLTGLFNVTQAVSEQELGLSVAIALIAFLVSFPTGAAVAVFHGYQEGYFSHAWGIAGSLLSLGALYAVTSVEGGLPQLVLALWGVRCVLSLACATHLFVWRRPWLFPSPGACSRRALGRLKGLGVRYLVAQLAGIGMFQSQPMIIAHVLGPAQVAVFNVAQRIVTLPLLMVQLAVTPLMPAYGEAFARGDWPWIRASLGRSFRLSLGAGLALVVVFSLSARPLIRLWVGAQLVPEWPLVLVLSSYVLVAAAVTPASVMLYGIGRVGKQAQFAVLNALATVLLGVFLTARLGLVGMGLAMTVAVAMINPAAQLIEVRRAFRLAASRVAPPR